MSANSAHSHPWKISDVVLFPLLAVGLIAEYLWPTSLQITRWLGIPIGIALFVGGFAIINWSKAVLDANEQPSLPGEPTTKLVTKGPFGWSRNPNYFGSILAGFGGALALNSLWVIGVSLLAAMLLEVWMIRPEEKYLSNQFGADYETYRNKVRRWI